MKNPMYTNNSAQAYGFAGLRHYVSDIDTILRRCRSAKDQTEAFDEAFIADLWSEETEPELQLIAKRGSDPVYISGPDLGSKHTTPTKKNSVLPAVLSVAAIVTASVGAVGLMRYMQHNDVFEPEVGRLQQTESPPPVGRGLVLSPPQIRYCIAQSIRLGAAAEQSTGLSPENAKKLESMYQDYDSRCAEYRFQAGAFDQARRQVEIGRADLEHQGLSLLRSQSTAQPQALAQQTIQLQVIQGEAPVVEDQPVREVSGVADRVQVFNREPRKYIKDLQWRLFKLKYYHGPIDGIDSPATQKALQGFFSVHRDSADTGNEKSIFKAVDKIYQQRH